MKMRMALELERNPPKWKPVRREIALKAKVPSLMIPIRFFNLIG